MNVQVLNNLPKHLHCHMFRRTRAAGLYRNGVELEMISVISFEPPVIIMLGLLSQKVIRTKRYTLWCVYGGMSISSGSLTISRKS